MKKIIVFCFFFGIIMLSINSAYSESTIIDPALEEHLNKISANITPQSQQHSSKVSINTGLSSPPTIQYVPVIVTLKNMDQNVKEKIINFLNQNGAKIKYNYNIIQAIALDIPYENIEKLSSNDYIAGIYLDKNVYVPKPDETFQKEINELRERGKFYPLLSDSTKAIGAPSVWNYNVDGSGVKVAILDTGIDKTHTGLKGKVINERDFTLDDKKLNPSDGFGHGTHVAGIIAGSGANSSLYVDVSSTNISYFKNIPVFEKQPHTGIVELDNVYHIFLTDWILKISPSSVLSYNDIPQSWGLYNNETYVRMIQENQNYTLIIIRDSTRIYRLSIDDGRSWITGNGKQNWGNETINFQTGVGGYAEIISDKSVVYLDSDGDLSKNTEQMITFENEHFKRHVIGCNYWECYDYWTYTEYFLSKIDTDNNIAVIGLDINWDYRPDIFKGVAPGAQLLNGKVLDDNGVGYNSGIIAGIEWAVLNHADVISMSLGGWQDICDGNDPLAQAVEKAWDMGSVVVISAGNSGVFGKETIGSPGCAKKVITVGASSKYAESQYIAYFSSKGPTSDGRIKPEVVAPGIAIISARADNTEMGYKYTSAYTSADGTSMAAPHVAGAIALLKQANSKLKPDEIKDIIINTADDFGESVFTQGAGQINISKAYLLVNKSTVLATPSILNIIVQNGIQTSIPLDAFSDDISLHAIKDDSLVTDDKTDTGLVSPTTGFNYTFNIPDDAYAFNISITWNNASNDIDMSLANPEKTTYYGSAGITNSESIYAYKPSSGFWQLYVYPFFVSKNVNVDISLKIYRPEKWDWFNYSSGELKITPHADVSGLYSGKIILNSTNNYVIIPASIIVSEQIKFKSQATHRYFGNNVCGEPATDYNDGTSNDDTLIGSSDRIASFDGYFCNPKERKAYSFQVPSDVPYLDILLWMKNYNPSAYDDARLFVYDPTGKEYDVSDQKENMEWSFIQKPMSGNWTLVVQEDNLYSLSNNTIQFSGEIRYVGMTIEPEMFSLNLKQNETFSTSINITNILDSDFFLRPIEASVWIESPLNFVPNTNIDNNKVLGPFGSSYKYYNFNITQDLLDNRLLKLETSLDGNSYLNELKLYVFDGNNTLVGNIGTNYGLSVYGYIYLDKQYQSGVWTVVVVGDGLYTEYPFNLKIWTMSSSDWNWITIIDQPTDYFTNTKNISFRISLPDNVTQEQYYGTLYLNGDWYSKNNHQNLEGTWSKAIYFEIYPRESIINSSLDVGKQNYQPTDEIIANAQLINHEAYRYKYVVGDVYWQVSYGNDTNTISKVNNVQIFGGERINLTQKWRANVLNPGDYVLTLIYNYTDYYGKNWIERISKRFNVALVRMNIPKQGSVNVTEADMNLHVAVTDSTNASLNLIKYFTNSINSTPSGMAGWNKFVQIEANNDLKGNLAWAMLKIYYNDSEISASGIDENSLKIYYLNESLNKWVNVESTGVNINDNYVWANLTHFSQYGVFGNNVTNNPPQEQQPEKKEDNKNVGSSSGGSGGGAPQSKITTQTCTEKWVCTSWTTCSNNMQTRTCNDKNNCNTKKNKPIESQSCIEEVKPQEELPIQDISAQNEEATTVNKTQEDLGPTGLATANVSKEPPSLGIAIIIAVIVISGGIFLHIKNRKEKSAKYNFRK